MTQTERLKYKFLAYHSDHGTFEEFVQMMQARVRPQVIRQRFPMSRPSLSSLERKLRDAGLIEPKP